MSISNYAETKILAFVFNDDHTSLGSNRYVQLHTGDPGEDGTANVSAETTRKAVTFATASAGSVSSNVDVSWTNWPSGANNETITHVSIWDASSSGNCLWSGALQAGKTMSTGETLTIPSGQLTVTLD